MSTLSIISGDKKFEVSGRDIINLELKLNQSDYGRAWKYIGDHIFGFYNRNGYPDQPSEILQVSEFQYQYLMLLNSRSLQNVYDENSQPPQ